MSALLLAAESAEPFSAVSEAAAGSVVDLAWLIPVVPAVMAGILLIFGKRLGRLSAALAIGGIGFSLTLSVLIFLFLQGEPSDHRQFVVEVLPWLDISGFTVSWSLLVDPLSAMMLLLVTGVGLLIHIYSLGYMDHDPRYERFFAYLNLFAASMLVLVLGSSFLTLFVGWELVGLSSYLLIGFWFEKKEYAAAAKKAFVTNRIGDVGFMVAMFIIFATFGSLEFDEVLPAAATATTGTLIAIGLLLFVGATGKSAQIPLYVWLPDAMAGPTPVSALIHAATMVTAGVYLIARTSPIFTEIPDIGLLVAWIGGITAFVSAAIACAQVDLKKILAYSTVSQLGYMFIGVGVGDYTAAVFHLLTHGFFKALLFLAAGSVMHAMADHTDIRNMGGLYGKMPITATTSLIAVLAIVGFPYSSGFFSKEEILAASAQTVGGELIWILGIIVAAMTAFYMTRWFVLIFLGDKRWGDAASPDSPTRDVHPHESPLSMTLPLGILAVASAAGGLLNTSPEDGWLHGWFGGIVVAFERVETWIPKGVILPTAIAAAVLGVGLGVLMYRAVDMKTVGTGAGMAGIARNKFYVDAFYEFFTVKLGGALATGFARADKGGIDGIVNGSAGLTRRLAGGLRRTQTGYVRSYALGILAGTVFLGILVAAAFLGPDVVGGGA
ncbi:NADH-quinone oxidoreductase subunit L [Euzebya tangerina]|uniref:NADH-quinone oxidoreductase subunit L n=1 Tax=Euzebya tangerina TaxID=591198 RepID=UPI000E31A3A2|nr:NADH-quinone oxidoreductase subunit L [Euzebya tangerina]